MSIKSKLSLAICVLVTAPMILGGTCAYVIARHYAFVQMNKELDNLSATLLAVCDNASQSGAANLALLKKEHGL